MGNERGPINEVDLLLECHARQELALMVERRVRETCECCCDRTRAEVLRQPDALRAFCENALARMGERHPRPIRITDDGEVLNVE